MSMKLSYRDKVIVIVVAVLVILGIGIFSFIKPKYEDLQVSKERLAAKEDEKAQVEEKMGTLEDLKKKLEDDINSVVEDQEQFLSEEEYGETYQISQYLMELLANDNFNITGMKVDRLAPSALYAYYYNKFAVAYPLKINSDINGELPPEVQYAATGAYPAAPAAVTLAGSVVTISYGCEEADELLEAVQTIADNDKNLYVMTFSGSYVNAAEFKETAEEKSYPFSGDITLALYEIWPLDPDDIKDAD
ncbi:MAG: hypothetical protein MSJ26_02400 [Oscillospiraceae bacterium]|nr:hypothetical protein [Oscillospiraceae bacterium]